jgi:hypothetical protein
MIESTQDKVFTPGPVRLIGDRGVTERIPRLALKSGALGCKPLQMVAGGRFELYSAYPIRVSAVPASIVATR